MIQQNSTKKNMRGSMLFSSNLDKDPGFRFFREPGRVLNRKLMKFVFINSTLYSEDLAKKRANFNDETLNLICI